MNLKYQVFIKKKIEEYRSQFSNKEYLEDSLVVRGHCSNMSTALVTEFPELRKVCGFCNGDEHWWCVDPKGEIVDGTRAQYGETVFYEEFNEEKHDCVVGRCYDCAEYIYGKPSDGHKDFCCDEHKESYIRYLNNLNRGNLT
jgi:hypothetical protein